MNQLLLLLLGLPIELIMQQMNFSLHDGSCGTKMTIFFLSLSISLQGIRAGGPWGLLSMARSITQVSQSS